MENFSFTLIILNETEATDELTEKVYIKAGCNDCLLSSSESVVKVAFDREANTFEEAVRSAQTDLNKVGIKTKLSQRADLLDLEKLSQIATEPNEEWLNDESWEDYEDK